VADTWLVDTNILLRFVQPDDRDYDLVQNVVRRLWTGGADMFYTSQNLAEFWNTCTRPAAHNGYGLSITETDERARLVERQFVLVAEDHAAVHDEWRRLVVAHYVSGVQVYDARLAAIMRVAGIPTIITFNTRDLRRYPGITAVHPSEVDA
jgi:predicted nucleic acid-binding protein